MKKILNISLFLFVIQLSSSLLYCVALPPVISNYFENYYCVESTIVSDNNKDGVYDTYSIVWCNGSKDTYPICAVGDIRKWPPTGIPSRDILQANYSDKSLTEYYYYTSNHYMICWFNKYAGIDTVYYYDTEMRLIAMTDVSDIDLLKGQSMDFLVGPNPAKDVINIEFNLFVADWVVITLYDEIGGIAGYIENKKYSTGNQIINYNTSNLPSGNYFMSVKIGMNEIFTRKIVIVK